MLWNGNPIHNHLQLVKGHNCRILGCHTGAGVAAGLGAEEKPGEKGEKHLGFGQELGAVVDF